MTQPASPIAIFETMRERAKTMLEAALLEAGKAPPTEEMWRLVYLPVLGIGIAAATEHFGQHPEHLAWAAEPICTVCREPIQTLQVGVDPARDQDDTEVSRIAWPCGHRQS